MDDSLPLTVLVPENSSAIIDVFDQHAALKVAVVERDGVSSVSAEWDVSGAYILLDRHDSTGQWGAYVGKAPAGIRNRLLDHVRKKDHWYRAVLIRRDTTFGFNSAQVGWLEGRLYDLFDAAEDAVLHNGNRPSDETLPPYDRQMLELAVLPVQRVLRLIGHDARAQDDMPPLASRRTKRHHGVTVAQLVEVGAIAAGARLTSTNGAWPASAVVTASGAIEYSGMAYPSPSTAAAAVKGGAANGWDFWAIDSGNSKVPLSVIRERSRALIETSPPSTPQ